MCQAFAWGTAVNKIDMVQALAELRHEGEGNERYPLRLKYRLYKSWDWRGKQEPGHRRSLACPPVKEFRIYLKAKRKITKLSSKQ